ncbi:MAG: hypothetical protein KF774_03435 [Planctomyces sp.]|nr:hypothetical protein [Planctomyces sp.]
MNRSVVGWAMACASAMATGRAEAQTVPVTTVVTQAPSSGHAAVRMVTSAPSRSPATAVEQAAAAASEASAAAEATPSPRLQLLSQLQYDRRPSSILKEWALPEPGAAGAADRPPAPPLPVLPGPDGTPAAVDPAVVELELKILQRHVTLGRWDAVKRHFARLTADDGRAAYTQMLRSLAIGPMDPQSQQRRNEGIPIEQNLIDLDDLISIVAACPVERDRAIVQQAAPLARLMLQSGVLADTLVARLTEESAREESERVFDLRKSGWLLNAANLNANLEAFLPDFETLLEDQDAEGLILYSQCQSAKFQQDGKPETLERAFQSAQPVVAFEKVSQEHRDQALQIAISLVPRVRKDLGHAWLESTFAGDPQFGMKVLSGLGASAASGLQTHPQSPSDRLQQLRIQKTVVESLLEKQPERAAEWAPMIRILAVVWLKEGETSRTLDRSTSYGPQMRRDIYGNFFYFNDDDGMGMSMAQQQRGVQPITTAEVIDVAPSPAWITKVDVELQPKFNALMAQLLLKVQEEERAFPLIEQLAASHPDLARDLTNEFLRVWTRNHDPNAASASRYTNSYMYMYGYEQRAAAIPLTRSKQERNLRELAAWIPRIRALPISKIDESLFAKAFTTCHSSAEVYRIEAIEEVFGSLNDMDPAILAQLVQQMRSNLQTIWRMPAQQDQAKTQRKQKDIEAEVVRGYGVARKVIEGAIASHPEDWRLALARACVVLDELNYRNELHPSAEFSERRAEAIGAFRAAAELYAKQVPALSEDEQSAAPYEHWFYASLGASDLGLIDHRSTPDLRQPPLIREALLALPGESAEKHIGKFANALFTRMGSIKPACKYTYLKSGFEIVGDAKQAVEARKVFDYYNDLVSEIRLVARIDGSARVGSQESFGVFIDLVHTPEIEREAGGFAKYTQNQNTMSYAYNYGRPLENYRDKFEEAARAALAEHFDVQSVTFQDKDVNARATDQPGWRRTPYAYLLLKARGPQVDKLPSLKMDLDFLDTSGYAVLPVVSAPLPMDAAASQPEARPYANVKIAETLDERQAPQGKLVLEVKATAQGLVPPLEELVDVRSSDFVVASTEDEGVAISRFDADSTEPAIISERTWTITYEGRKDLAALPTSFAFPTPKVDTAETTFLRYEDADLKSVDPVVALVQQYGETQKRWPWFLAGGACLALALFLFAQALRQKPAAGPLAASAVPERLTPFTLLTLLRKIEHSNGFDFQTKEELDASIRALERRYFADQNGEAEPDLKAIAERWLVKGGRRR